jgi:hypothetical protein
MSNPTAQPPRITLAAGDAEYRIRATSPVNVLDLVPYLLGFHPNRSVVIIGTEVLDGRVRVTLNCALPDAADQSIVADYMEHAVNLLNNADCSHAVVVAYGPESQVMTFVEAFWNQAALHNISVPEALRTEDSRYWSYVCADPTCCRPKEHPLS